MYSFNLIIVFITILFRSEITAQDISERIRTCSLEILHHTSTETDNHVVLSPFGIWTLLAGISIGAEGNTYDEIRKAFRLPKSETRLAKQYQNVTNEVLKKSDGVTLVINNFVFVDDKLPFNPYFKTIMESSFYTNVKRVNFKDPNSAARIANAVIKSESGGLISDVLIPSDFLNSRMLLTNVIHFQGLWGMPFNKSNTVVEQFYNDNGERIGEVNMMYQRGLISFSNVKKLGGYAIELPYGDGKFSMLCLLPYPGTTVNEMFKKLEIISLNDIFKKLIDDAEDFGLEDVDVKLPRFKISTNIVLNKPLNDMGVYDMFDPSYAQFGRISRESLFVSSIVHKADIEVTESGTVASAVSTAQFANRNTPPAFIGNRPFVYFVLDKSTMTVLFGGFYSKPTLF